MDWNSKGGEVGVCVVIVAAVAVTWTKGKTTRSSNGYNIYGIAELLNKGLHAYTCCFTFVLKIAARHSYSIQFYLKNSFKRLPSSLRTMDVT